jgi:ABC-type multidrug transport system fused ATPase/permease subunit
MSVRKSLIVSLGLYLLHQTKCSIVSNQIQNINQISNDNHIESKNSHGLTKRLFQDRFKPESINADKKTVAISIFVALVGTVCSVIPSLFFGNIVQELTRPNLKFTDVLKPILVVLIAHTLEPMCTVLFVRLCTKLIDDFIVNIRKKSFSTILGLDYAAYDNMGSNEATNIVVIETEKMRDKLIMNTSRDRGIRSVMELIIGMAILWRISLPLGSLFSIILIVSCYISTRIGKYFPLTIIKRNIVEIKLQSKVQEVFTNFKEVFSYSNRPFEEANFGHLVQDSAAAFYDFGRAKANLEASNRAAIYSNVVLVLGIGSYFVYKNMIAPYKLLSFFGYCFSLNFAMQGLLYSYGDWQVIRTSWKLLKSYIKNGYSVNYVLPTRDIQMKRAMDVKLKDVYFSYPTREDVAVLRGVNIHFPAGKVTALVSTKMNSLHDFFHSHYESSIGRYKWCRKVHRSIFVKRSV